MSTTVSVTTTNPSYRRQIERFIPRETTPYPTQHANRGEETRSMVASARRLLQKDLRGRNVDAQGGAGKTKPWQDEAWELDEEVGEQHFLSTTLANRLSQATLYVGKISKTASPGTKPDNVLDEKIQSILYAIGDGPAGLGQILHRMAVNLFVAGEGWLVGIPPRLVPGTPQHRAATDMNGRQVVTVNREEESGDNILDMTWRMLSVSEISTNQDGEASIRLEDGSTIEAPVSVLYMIRIWRPHARRAWEADSATRASLPVLRELLGLTMHVSAQIDSRLAGNGLLLFPTSADAALRRAYGIPEDSEGSPLLEALIEAATTAIKDRASAAALMPIVASVPDETVDKIKHLTFTSPLDKEARNLRDEAIRRLALGQDAPPELLLGTGGMNHWGAWLVREDVVQTHLEPPLALICDALTTQYLRPVLEAMKFTPEQAEEYVVWYDVDNLIEKPSKGGDAKELYRDKVISAKAVRDATGFEDSDAYEEPEGSAVDIAVQTALDMIAKAPSLAQNPGIPNLVEQIRSVLNPNSSASTAASEEEVVDAEVVEDGDSEGGTPDTRNDAPPVGTPGNPNGGAA